MKCEMVHSTWQSPGHTYFYILFNQHVKIGVTCVTRPSEQVKRLKAMCQWDHEYANCSTAGSDTGLTDGDTQAHMSPTSYNDD